MGNCSNTQFIVMWVPAGQPYYPIANYTQMFNFYYSIIVYYILIPWDNILYISKSLETYVQNDIMWHLLDLSNWDTHGIMGLLLVS